MGTDHLEHGAAEQSLELVNAPAAAVDVDSGGTGVGVELLEQGSRGVDADDAAPPPRQADGLGSLPTAHVHDADSVADVLRELATD